MSNNHSLEKRNLSAFTALMSNILIVLGFYFMFNGFAAIIMKLYAGKIPQESDFLATGPEADFMKTTLLAGHIGGALIGMILLPILYVFYLNKPLKEKIVHRSADQAGLFVALAIAITFIILPLIGTLADWNKSVHLPEGMKAMEDWMRATEQRAAEMTKMIVISKSTTELLWVLFTVALLPAVGEELVFRGILQNNLEKAFGNVHVAVWISAAVFSFIHFQFLGFFPRMLLGIVLGYLYITSGNILVSMLMHFTNNAMAVIALNLHAKGQLEIDPDSSKDLPAASIYLSVILSSVLMYLCWNMYKQRMNTERPNV